jgi:ParB family chromosome partitioning protein
MATKHGLGRGLDVLIKDKATASETPRRAETGRHTLPLDKIRKSPWQPRRQFNEDSLAELSASIRERGIIQPLIVRPVGDHFELIAGERRLRAAEMAGLKEVPVSIVSASDNDALLLALIENLQREDLDVVEEAEGYQTLAKKFGLTQDQIAQRVGKARASVTNVLRILDLPPEVRKMIVAGELSSGHAKVLLGLEIPEERLLLARRTVKEGLSVRALEKIVQNVRRAPRKARAVKDDIPQDHVSHISDRLHQHFGTAVRIEPCRTFANGKKARGVIEIDFYSNDDLDRILNLLGLVEE